MTKRAIILGNELVDIQHRQLVGLTKRLSESIAATDPQETPTGLLTELCSRLLSHDATEEAILRTRSPASYSMHKAAHARMAFALLRLTEQIAARERELTIDTAALINLWLIQYFAEFDVPDFQSLGAGTGRAEESTG